MTTFYHIELESGQHVEIQLMISISLDSIGQHVEIRPMFSIALDSRVVKHVDMLMDTFFYFGF